MDTPVKFCLCLVLLWGLVYPSHCHAFRCEDQSLLPCERTKECYSVNQRCNGVWDCSDRSDEADCSTDSSVTKGQGVFGSGTLSKGQNLAWLVTPILLLLGAAYGVYKCVKDGICLAIKRRLTRSRSPESRASDYHPLHQVSFSTSTRIPCTQLGLSPAACASLTPLQQQQLMLVHNQSFSIQLRTPGADNPATADGATALPPTYEEAMSTVSDGNGGTLLVTRDGRIVGVPGSVRVLPPSYSRSGPKLRGGASLAGGPGPHMEAIEELEEEPEGAATSSEDEDDDHPDNADEQTFFLPPREPRSQEGRGGRRRHHSQWSNKQRTDSRRRRHHSCPS